MPFIRIIVLILAASAAALLDHSHIARAAEGTLDRHAFAQAFADHVQREFHDAKVVVRDANDKNDVIVESSWPDGGQWSWFAGNAYREYMADPARLEAILQQHVRTMQETRKLAANPAAADARRHVIPVIKTRAWFDAMHAQLAGVIDDPHKLEAALPLHRAFTGDLLVAYVEDGEAGMSFVTSADLGRLGAQDVDALERLARDNLASRIGTLKVAGKDGRYRLELDNNYEASMVLLLDRWRDQVHIDGDPVIAIASRETVMICGSRDRSAIDALRGYAAKISETPYGLSRTLYTVRDGKWVAL